MTAAERGIRRRQRLFVVFTAVLVLAYARQLVNAPTAGQDFRAFFAAATLAAHGGDPYDWTALGHTEEALYNSPGHIRVGDAAYYDFLPYPAGLDQAEPRPGPSPRRRVTRAGRRAPAVAHLRRGQRAGLRRRGPGPPGRSDSLAGRDPLALAGGTGLAAGHRLDP